MFIFKTGKTVPRSLLDPAQWRAIATGVSISICQGVSGRVVGSRVGKGKGYNCLSAANAMSSQSRATRCFIHYVTNNVRHWSKVLTKKLHLVGSSFTTWSAHRATRVQRKTDCCDWWREKKTMTPSTSRHLVWQGMFGMWSHIDVPSAAMSRRSYRSVWLDAEHRGYKSTTTYTNVAYDPLSYKMAAATLTV